MVICPIARAVHCTGCVFFKFCPAKKLLGDYGKSDDKSAKDSPNEAQQKNPADSGEDSPPA